jgi:hypothetical protein
VHDILYKYSKRYRKEYKKRVRRTKQWMKKKRKQLNIVKIV